MFEQIDWNFEPWTRPAPTKVSDLEITPEKAPAIQDLEPEVEKEELNYKGVTIHVPRPPQSPKEKYLPNWKGQKSYDKKRAKDEPCEQDINNALRRSSKFT